MSRTARIFIGIGIVLVIIFIGYAIWYTHHRNSVIADTAKCNRGLTHPETLPHMRAPDGTMVPVMTPCKLEPIPPTFWELLTGDTTPSDVPTHMRVLPYTFWDVVFGRYAAVPYLGTPCDQSATTTDCNAVLSGTTTK